MAYYVVTGGAGFIGSHLCRRLTALNHRVLVIDDLSNGRCDALTSNVELVVGDAADAQLVRSALAEADGCFHLAAVASVQRSSSDWIGAHRSNLTAAIAVFDAARRIESRGPIPVVYASSAAVYGDNSELPLKETHRPDPLSAYGADKLGCELHAKVATLNYGIPTTGLRFFNVFGPGQDPNSPYSGVVSIFAKKVKAKRALTIFGDGEQSRDLIHIDDVVEHLIAAMETSTTATAARVLNVCSGEATSIRQLAAIMMKIMDVSLECVHLPARADDIRHSLGDPELCRRELGLRIRRSVGDGLAQMLSELGI